MLFNDYVAITGLSAGTARAQRTVIKEIHSGECQDRHEQSPLLQNLQPGAQDEKRVKNQLSEIRAQRLAECSGTAETMRVEIPYEAPLFSRVRDLIGGTSLIGTL
jgi:hypothetical protein